MKKYVITDGDLFELLHDSAMLNEIYNAGVDNWEGFDRVGFPSDEKILNELNEYEVID